ncbi:MAG: YdeI/OmpD-associated family protein, partial [Rhodobacteraceae bacterium]|nr:YdeI/OmpD-associated family protein [Paracoccaceae bacterium]
LERPADLEAALTGDLLAGWEAYPRSVKRGTLEWIKQAKTPPTRAKRIADVAASLAEGLRPSPFRR